MTRRHRGSRRFLMIGACLILAGVAGISASSPAEAFWFFGKKEVRAAQPVAEAVKASQEPLTLDKAYALSLKRSETLAIQREKIEEAQGRFYDGLSYILPSIHFEMTRQDQDTRGLSSSSDGLGGSALRPSTPQKKFVFSQPLFSGFKEFAALAGSRADKMQQEYLYQHARNTLFLNVVEAFYALLEAKVDTEILRETQKSLSERIENLKERVALGRSRESELQTSLSDLKLVEAEIAQNKRVEAMARELLEFYIGESAENGLVEEGPAPAEISDVTAYLSKRSNRPDVRAAEEAYRLAQKKVIGAQAGFFPKISLDGNYYTQRVGYQSGTDWDTTLKFDVPIFDGADTLAQVKQTSAQREQARLGWEESKRLADLEIRRDFDSYSASVEEEMAFSGAQEASKKTYELQVADYQKSLVNNLEVLDALRRYQDIRRRWNSAYFAVKKNYWILKASVNEVLS